MTVNEAAKIALEKFAETSEYERYSPAVKLIGTYFVHYKFGDYFETVYEFECFENIQIHGIKIDK